MRPLVHYSAVLAILALMTGSCATESPTQPDPDPVVAVTIVSVSPDSASVLPGATRSYTAETLGPAGETLGRDVTWSTADATIAAVDGSTGLVTGVSVGVTTVTAASEGTSGSAKVVVVPIPVSRVVVTPESATLDVGNTAPFSAQTLDASGAMLSGRDVQWTTADPTVATVDPESGLVAAWSQGSTSLIAASEGVADTASVVVVDPSLPAGRRIWRADAADTEWTNAGNWIPTGAPGVGDTVLIRAGGNQPVLSDAVTLGALELEAGGSLGLDGNTLTVNGDVDAGSPGISGPGTVELLRSGTTTGTVPDLVVAATTALAGSTAVTGDLTVTGSGRLEIGAETLTVAGDFMTEGEGRLVMTDAAGELDVDGRATFAGLSEGGELTAGTLRIGGDFMQSSSIPFTQSLAATDAHLTVLDGAGDQTVSFGTSAFLSHFANLTISGGDVTLSGSIRAMSDVSVTSASTVAGESLMALGTLTSVPGSIIVPDQVSLGTGMAIGGTFSPRTTRLIRTIEIQAGPDYQDVSVGNDVTVTLAAGATSVSGDVSVGGTLEIGPGTMTVAGDFSTVNDGRLVMTDAAGELDVEGDATFDGGSLIGLLTAGTLRVGGDFLQTNTISDASFRARSDHLTILDGSSAQTVTFVTPGFAQSTFADLTIAGGDVMLSSEVIALGDVSVTSASAVTGAELRVERSLTTAAGSSITPAVVEIRSGMTIGGTFSPTTTVFFGALQIQPGLDYQDVVVRAGIATVPAGTTAVRGDLSVSAGRLVIGPGAMTVAGDLATENIGRLVMTDAAGELDVEGDATFDGGSLSGLLTAGTLRVGGDFTQTADFFSTRFAASDAHHTILDGTSTQVVSFGNPVAIMSRFADLTIAGADVTLSTAVVALGDVSVTSPSEVTGEELQVGGALTSVAGSNIIPDAVELGSAMSIGGAFSPATTEFTETIDIQPGLGYRNIVVSSGTASVQAGTTAVSEDVTVIGSGQLEIGSGTMTVAGELATLQGGQLVMADPAGVLDVETHVVFAGLGREGLLTAGTLRVGGDFEQRTGTSATTFAASDAHVTVLDGTSGQLVLFDDPLASESRFANFSATGPQVTFVSDAVVSGSATLSGSVTLQPFTLDITANLTLANGLSLVNDGTINVGGTCTDNGATVTGRGGGNVACVRPR